jgi:hypothetical protein
VAGSRNQSRVVLHVGLPKSGTTFLQRSLAQNAEALGDRGVLYPQTDDDVMFRAALDVRGNHKAWGRRRKEVEGAWDRLAGQAHAHVGTTVISHEILGAACRRQVDRAMSMLKGLEVHVVVTARDPARQLVSEWQEGIKHGRRLTFAEFEAGVRAGHDGVAQHFHSAQDLPAVLGRWGHWLPADQVHLVTGPPDGADPRLLWSRLGEVVGFDPDGFPPAGPGHANESLGVDEIDLLRRVNVALDGRLTQPAYGRLAKHRVAQDLLGGRGSARPRLPLPLYDALVPLAEQWAKEVDRAGYTVHGDLDDLLPVPPDAEPPHPDRVSPATQVEVAAEVVAGLLLDLAAAHEEVTAKDAKRRSWKKQAKKLADRLALAG